MSEDPNERLDRLEARVAALEAAVSTRTADRAAALPAGSVLDAIRRTRPTAPLEGEPRPAAEPAVGPAAGAGPGKPPAHLEPPPLPSSAPAARSGAAAGDPSAPPPRPVTSDLERFVGLAVLGRIGIAAVVLAAAYFAQLGWGRLGPVARVAAIYALSAALLGAGLLLRPRVAPKYTAFLLGGATALSYLAGVVAEMRYHLLGTVPALGVLLASAALGQWLARFLRIEAMATVALAGAYAAPVLVGRPSASPTALYVLLLALHTWAAFTDRQWGWRSARRLAVAATALLAAAWLLLNPTPPPLSLVLHVEAILLGLAAPELLAAARGTELPMPRKALVLTGFAVVHLGLLAHTVSLDGAVAGFGLVTGAAILGAGTWWRRGAANRDFAAGLAHLGSVLVVLGAWLAWDAVAAPFGGHFDQRWARLAAVVGATAGLLAVRRWTGVFSAAASVAATVAVLLASGQQLTPEARCQAGLALSIPVVLLLAGRLPVAPVIGLGLGCLLTFTGATRNPGFGGTQDFWTAIAFAVTGAFAAFGALAGAHRRSRTVVSAAAVLLGLLGIGWARLALLAPPGAAAELTPFWNLRFLTAVVLLALVELGRRRLPADADPAARVVFASIAGGIGYLAGLAELLTFVSGWPHGWSAVTISLYSLLFAGGALVAGFVRKVAVLRWVGLVGFALVVLKVAVYDLSELATPLRVLVTGVLGLVLLAGSWAYAKNRVQPAAASR